MYPRPATAGAPESLLRSTAGARGRLLPLAALIAVTATSGAFVAGARLCVCGGGCVCVVCVVCVCVCVCSCIQS